jgi:hypothetical protein
MPAVDPELLNIPAQLISISHFPAFGRPQAGLSFAPFVYEISITEGATRFLAVFYGEYPAPEAPAVGDCAVRTGAFTRSGLIIGNRVWLDANDNGQHDFGEQGVGGVCVNLYDAAGNLAGNTTTDSNGYYGFNVPSGSYMLEFVAPAWARFAGTNLGDASSDSDADPATGRVEAVISSDVLDLDVGLVPLNASVLNPDPALLPLAQVGPIRSGRLVYEHISRSFPNSCLIYAGASSEVLVHLPQCLLVFHQFAGGGYMLDLNEMQAVAKKNRREKGRDFDYSGYVFSKEPPSGGVPAEQLNVFIAYLNQSGWIYDPLYEAYLRFVDTSDKATAGVLFPDRDRLTGRQIHFENVIVVFAKHDVVSPTNLDIRLNPGREGDALLFRDGRMYEIEWQMPAANEDAGPMRFIGEDGNSIALKPGHTWVLVVTPFSTIEEKLPGEWTVRFWPPDGAQ